MYPFFADHVPLVLLSIALALLPGLLLLRALRVQQDRIARLEEALRTYNNAGAAVGRHVTALEAEIRASRLVPAEPVRVERTVLSRGTPEAGAGPAERRLAELIRSRQGAASLN